MNKQDRSSLIKLASSLENGNEGRRAILTGLQKVASETSMGDELEYLLAMVKRLKLWRAQGQKADKEFDKLLRDHGDWFVKQEKGILIFSEPGDVDDANDPYPWKPLKDVLREDTSDWTLHQVAVKRLWPMEASEHFMYALGPKWGQKDRLKKLNEAINSLEYLQW